MAFKLMQAAQDRWRAVNAPHLVALVRAGATFIDGELVERPDGPTETTASQEAAWYSDPPERRTGRHRQRWPRCG